MSLIENGTLDLNTEFYGEKTIILSKSGFGKSYTARVLIEEGVLNGHTFTIIDPQDAYLNMPEFDYMFANDVKSAKSLGALLAISHKNVVIRMKRLSVDDQNKFLAEFLKEFKIRLQKGIQTIVVDEMHKYAPEGEKTASKDILRGMFQENRSDGLGIIGVSQRISRVDKTCLAQADNLLIGRVTAFRDKEAVKNYIDDPNDLEKIKSLERGSFYLYGCGLDSPTIYKIRASKTEHSGSSPKNLLNENSSLYSTNVKKFVRKGKNMSETISTEKGALGILPSSDSFMDAAKLGMKMALGGAVGGLAGAFVGSRFASPIPVISSRTLGSAASTAVLFLGYRNIRNPMIKDVLKFSTAGAAAYTVGSLAFDVLRAFNVNLPNIATFALSTATGASPVSMEKAKAESGADVDMNTVFA